MKVTFELTSIEQIEAVVAALKGKNTQAVMQLAPTGTVSMKAIHEDSGEEVTVKVPAEVKPEPAKRGRKPKAEATVEQPVVEAPVEEAAESKTKRLKPKWLKPLPLSHKKVTLTTLKCVRSAANFYAS